MRIGGSLFLVAVGAVLAFAVKVHNTHGFNVHTAGIIVMIVGAIGLLASVMWATTRRRTDIVQRGPMGTRGTTVLSPNDPIDTY